MISTNIQIRFALHMKQYCIFIVSRQRPSPVCPFLHLIFTCHKYLKYLSNCRGNLDQIFPPCHLSSSVLSEMFPSLFLYQMRHWLVHTLRISLAWPPGHCDPLIRGLFSGKVRVFRDLRWGAGPARGCGGASRRGGFFAGITKLSILVSDGVRRVGKKMAAGRQRKLLYLRRVLDSNIEAQYFIHD